MTATSQQPTPVVLLTKQVTLDLVKAAPMDFKEYAGQDRWGNAKYKRRIGMVYWLFSYTNNKFDSAPYMMTESTNGDELKDFLQKDMVFVARNPFRD